MWERNGRALALLFLISFIHSCNGGGASPTLTLTGATTSVNITENNVVGYNPGFMYTKSSDLQTFALSGTDAAAFNIDTLGTITLAKVLDAEDQDVYNVNVTGYDSGLTASNVLSLTLTLDDVNDNAPACSPSLITYLDIDENDDIATGSGVLMTLACTDDDIASPNNQLEYTFVDIQTDFSIDATTGEVTITTEQDYETTKSLTLKINVADSAAGALTSTATIILTINALNDVVPSWDSLVPIPDSTSPDTYNIGEDTAIGTSLFKAGASDGDDDVGNSLTYSIDSAKEDPSNTLAPDVFSINPSTGEVSLQKSLDVDGSIDGYLLTIKVSDGDNSVTTDVTITLTDVNDNSPTFINIPSSAIVITEANALTNSVVTTLTGSDEDDSPTLTYSVSDVILGNSEAGDWQFSALTPGQLEFAVDIDYDADPSKDYNVLRVVVTDEDSKAGTATVTVSISPVNEHDPTVTFTTASGQDVAEDTAVGNSINQAQGGDVDSGDDGVLVYSIDSGNTNDDFRIDADTGKIYVQKSLDKERTASYSLVIGITDSGTSPRSIQETLELTITDVNDNTPECTVLFAAVDVAENEAVDFVVVDLTSFGCSDADGDTIAFTVLSPESNNFKISGNNLALKTALDYETEPSYLVQVKVEDTAPQSTTIKVSVTVTAVNEDTPTFASNPSFDKYENSATGSLTTYTADDTDNSPHDIVSYSIFSVTNSGSSLFGIDTSSGEISLIGNLDYEALPGGDKKYEIVVIATDGGGLVGSGTVIVNVQDADDSAPTCTKTLWSVDLDETQTGTGPWSVVDALGCTDPEGTTLTYSLAQSSPSASFDVTSDKVTLTADDLNYENADLHVLTITVTDAGVLTQDTEIIVNVIVNNLNDGPPVISATTDVDKPESLAVGSSIAVITAIDPDDSDPSFGNVEFSILSGDTKNQFSIDVTTGEILLQKALDYEADTSYNLVIQAKEKVGGGTDTETQVVNVEAVNDNSPTCTPGTLYETVPEDSAIGYVIRALGCSDDDVSTGSTLTYTITNGDTSLFEISGTNFQLKALLDFETTQSHTVSITVSDGDASHNFVLSGIITVGSVDDGPPVFTLTTYPVDVSESEAVGFLVETVVANDPDSSLDSNGQVVYTFVNTYSDFSLDSSTGKITLAKQLDRDAGTTDHELKVRASDDTTDVTATVTITVTDANDNTPVFSPSSYLATISELDASGTAVVTVAATDADDPATSNYGTVAYTLSGTGSSDFVIDSSSGEITSATTMDADTTASYSLTVTATDSASGAGAKSSTANVVITVTKVNQNTPAFQLTPYTKIITENELSIGDEILKVTATDSDSGDNGDVTISFAVAQTKFNLVQTGDVASITLAEALDFESGDTSFVIDVQAADGGSPPKVATETVTITVNDDNDNSPLCTTSVVNVAKDEGETSVATLSCTDSDPGTTLTYSVVSENPTSITALVSTAGVVTVTTALDYETDDAYVIEIKVADDGVPVKSTTVTINLYVNDLNDNDPSFSGTPFSFDIDEDDTADGTALLTVTASSNDGPTDTVTCSLTGTTNFDVTADSPCEITLKGTAPDRETVGASTTFQVCASDTANPTVRNVCETVTVNIADVNDNTPIFNPAVYADNVGEDTATTISIGQVYATDADASASFNTITYSITAGNTGTAFSVESTGVVKVASALDYETTTSYSLTIQASDGTLASTVQFEITITSVNEYDPTFSPGTKAVSVEEDAALGDAVFTAAATDADDGDDGDFTYSIDSGPFAIDPTSGAVSVSGVLDRETTTSYTINVYAKDKGTTPRIGTLIVTFNVDDVNDQDPTCSSNPYSASIAEDDGAGTAVVSLVCTDADDDPSNINNDLTYALLTHTGLFEVDTSGAVTVKTGASFDRETLSTYTLTIDVVDKPTTGKRTFTATVSVIITDINDNDPSFTIIPTTVNVEESRSVGSVIGSGAATDADDGLNSDVSYSITGGNTDSTFQIDADSGDVTLVKALDYENTQSYSLTIEASDKGATSRSKTDTLTVSVTDENDTPPVCGTSFYSHSLVENTVSQAIVTVACTDTDTVGSVTYAITAGDTNGDFEINTNSGVLTSKASANLDFETTPEIIMTVTASDGVLSDTTTVKVFVTDENETPPVFDPSGPFTKSVSEDEAVGFSIMQLTATDDDTDDDVKIFTITAGNSAAKFSLDASTGELNVQGPLDRETTPSYSLTVKVTDSGGSASSTTITINLDDVNDNSPTCTVTTAAVAVEEGATSGNLYLPDCDDLDTVATPTLSYSISSGADAALDIDTTTGRLYLAGAFDYETATSHTVVIEVSDQDTPTPKTTQITVELSIEPVNEHDPVFTVASSGPFSVSEDEGVGTSIGEVSATDDDSGALDGTVRYSLEGGDALGQFGVDATTGDIKVLKALDRETTASYTLTIRASDDEPGSDDIRTVDITTTVNVDDVNDVTPTFNPTVYSVNVNEAATYGPAVVLVQLIVSDEDDGVNGEMDITIFSGNAEGKFAISGTDMTLIAALDYETTTSYQLVLEVADRGVAQLKSTARVVVNVEAANERAPLMDAASSVTNASIAEDVSVGSIVYDANATDIDSGIDGEITYSIDSGVSAGEFLIDPTTGELTVSSALDYDTAPTTYEIVIRATDGQGLTSTTSTVTLSITLTDVNDNPPQFQSSTLTFSLQENAVADFAVGTVVATDLDVGANGVVNYTKTSGTGMTLFDINAATGDVTVIGDIDYETAQRYYLYIKATDNGDTPRETTDTVIINIENMNDNDPVITPVDFAVNMDEDAAIGTAALTLAASDQDTAIDSFSLVDPDSFFQIDATSGEVTTKANLDRETDDEHVLKIRVIDKSTTSDPTIRSATATLTIIVGDINDNDPTITGTYTPSVLEDASLNELVFTLVASDIDADENAQLEYSIEAGDPDNHFRIDSSGNVQVNAALDRETTDSYTLTFKVTDKGTTPRSDQRDITITVTDVNDNDPVFTENPYTMNVAENTGVGDAVGTVVATDADAGVNAALTYSFESFNVGDSTHFAIDGATGDITVDTTALDRETQATYTVSVKAQDSGSPLSRSSLTVVNINIDDLDDNPPEFTASEYTGDVDENADLTTVILTVAATDLDIGVNADLTYSIDTSTADGVTANTYLEIDGTTGDITPKINIDYEVIKSFNFTVIATDAGVAPLEGSAIVVVTVNDVNDNNPVFSPTFYNTEIAYNAVCDSSITTLTATDADSGVNAELSFSLLTVDNAFLIKVGSATGKVSLQAAASANKEYTYTFRAADNGNPILTSATAATVRVDTFVPNNHVVTIRLKLTRADFELQRDTFLTNLQTLLRTVHNQAIPRIWCISEWDGTAVSPGAARRRLLSTAPVDVHVVALEDGTSETEGNIGTTKKILSQDEIYAILAADANGTPDASLSGTGWDNLNIVKILQYYDDPDGWFEKEYGIAITVIACLLGLLFIFTLLYAVFVCWYRRFHPGKVVRRRKVRVTEVSPSPEPPHEEAWKSKGVLPSYDNDYLAGSRIPPLPSVSTPPDEPSGREPYSFTPAPRYRSPSQVIVRADSSYNIVNREFDGRAFDPESGRMYEYNTKTNERRWID